MRRAALPLEKLARAAKLSAESARLFAEAAEELQANSSGPTDSESAGAKHLRPVTEMDKARARAALKKAGYRI
jgi:hypothetical protein